MKSWLNTAIEHNPKMQNMVQEGLYTLNRLGFGAQSIWEPLLHRDDKVWQDALETSKKGQRILIATCMGLYSYGAFMESALAVALTLRGARVDVLLCDCALPACQMMVLSNISPNYLKNRAFKDRPLCKLCQNSGKRVFKPLLLPILWYSDFFSFKESDIAKSLAETVPLEHVGEYKLDGLAVGEHALAGVLRYFARGNLIGESSGNLVLQRYLESSILTTLALKNLLGKNDYEVVCFNHGIYVPQGLISEVLRQKNIRIVTWNPAYRKHCFIFSHGDTYHHTMISEPTSNWEESRWTPELEARTLDYLKSRWQGNMDWICFNENPKENLSEITQETGIDLSKPLIGMLTNVMWDAQLHYHSNAFSNMLDWVIQTITYFRRRPDLQLIIRIHPAELRGFVPSRQPIMEEIKKRFPTLPSNIFIIPPESQVSTYAVMNKCNAVIIYNTKTGIEVSSMGIPVIVAGEAWIRNKGFSLDASSPKDYFEILDQLPLQNGLPPNELQRARKYAYHFFFRRMIPLPFIATLKDNNNKLFLKLSSMEELMPGVFPGLDVICNGITHGTPFIYHAEESSPYDSLAT